MLTAMSPDDVCPYRRPFPRGFSECPAFQPTAFLPRTSRETPLEERWTCSHLDVGEAGAGDVRDSIAFWRAQRDPVNAAEAPAEALERNPEIRRLLAPDAG